MIPAAVSVSRRACVYALATGLAVAAAAGPVRADTKAVDEFRAGRALVAAGKCDEAIPRFRASLALAPAVGPLMNLGECLARTGKTLSAARAFEDAAALARRTRDPERAAASERTAEALRAKVSTLTVRAPALNRPVLVDGNAVALGVPVALDGGDHVITLDLEDGHQLTKTVHLEATGDGRVVDLGAELASGGAPERPERGAAPPREQGGWSAMRIGAAAAGGASVAALVVGTVFGIAVLRRQSDIHTLCPGYPRCSGNVETEVRDLYDEARHDAVFSTIGIAVGVGLAATAVALFVVDLRRQPSRAARRLRPDVLLSF
jgi:hypothetical protein